MMSRKICIFFCMLAMLSGCELVKSPGRKLGLSKKAKQSFSLFDETGDGFLSRKESERVAERFAEMENFNPAEKAAVRQSFDALFSLNTAASGTKGGDLTAEGMIESVNVQRDSPEYKKAIDDIVRSLYTPVKVQEKGYFNLKEYRRIFRSLGFQHDVFTKAAFTAIDVDHDGKVSLEELRDAVVGYMTSDDEDTAPLFGPLP